MKFQTIAQYIISIYFIFIRYIQKFKTKTSLSKVSGSIFLAYLIKSQVSIHHFYIPHFLPAMYKNSSKLILEIWSLKAYWTLLYDSCKKLFIFIIYKLIVMHMITLCIPKIVINFFLLFSLQYIKMSGKNINFNDNKIRKSYFYINKKIYNIVEIDTNKILVSKKHMVQRIQSLYWI